MRQDDAFSLFDGYLLGAAIEMCKGCRQQCHAIFLGVSYLVALDGHEMPRWAGL